MRISPAHPISRRGFTLVELLTVISIIAVIAALSYAGVGRAIHSARSTDNIAHLRQIGVALRTYAGENDNHLPPVAADGNTVWDRDSLAPYLPKREDGRQNRVFISPTAKFQGVAKDDISRAYTATESMLGIDPVTGNVSFVFRHPRNLNSIGDPATAPLVFDGRQNGTFRYSAELVKWEQLDSAGDLDPEGQPRYIDYRNQGDKAHFLYVDGHVDALSQAETGGITRAIWQGIAKP